MPQFVKRLVLLLAVVVVTVGGYLWLRQPATTGDNSLPPRSEPGTPALAVAQPTSPAPTTSAPTRPPATATRVPPTATPEPTPTLPPRLTEGQAMERYGSQSYAALEEMPPELRRFYEVNISEIAEFFQVPAADLMALVQQQGGGQFRLPVLEGDSAALLPPDLWNGPGAPPGAPYLTSQDRIEIAGGMGFSWAQRFQWQTWARGRGGAGMTDVTADPYRFTNGAAALARYLAQQGVTIPFAEGDSAEYARRLAGAVEGLRSATNHAVLAAPADPVGNPWAVALQQQFDRGLGMALPADTAIEWMEIGSITGRAATPEEGAQLLYSERVQEWLAQGRAATAEGHPLAWPYVADETDLAIQESSVRILGHVLTPPDLQMLRSARQGNLSDIERSLEGRTEATLYAESRAVVDSALRRSARGLPLYNYEVSALVQDAIAVSGGSFGGWSSGGGSERGRTRTQIRLRSEVQYFLRRLPEYRAIHGDQFFSATPFDPMPSMGQPFGNPVTYQSGGAHTGVDIRARGGGDATVIRAVEDGTVAHVGPLFCLSDSACRGPYAVVLHHGNNVYTIYSHNSEAYVSAGEEVTAGQPIARQGSEGYSRGPHLHLEVHVGAAYSGDWTNPWRGGEYIDPWPWLPKES